MANSKQTISLEGADEIEMKLHGLGESANIGGHPQVGRFREPTIQNMTSQARARTK